MKIYYFNDRHQTVTIQVNHRLQPVPHNPYGEPKIEYFKLQPQNGQLFEIDATEGSIPYVKVWEAQVFLLTYISAAALEQLQRPSHKL